SDESRPPAHPRVRNEQVEGGEECTHHHVRRHLQARGGEDVEKRQLTEHSDRSTLQCATRHADEDDQDDGPDHDQGHVLAHPPGEAARLLDAPEKIEAVPTFLIVPTSVQASSANPTEPMT